MARKAWCLLNGMMAKRETWLLNYRCRARLLFFSCYSRGDLYVTKGGGKRLFRVAEGERS